MLYPLMPQTKMEGEADFYCSGLKRRVALAKCMDWFVDHNALRRKESPCFKCALGTANRENFARS
jgi:hypothetical protein